MTVPETVEFALAVLGKLKLTLTSGWLPTAVVAVETLLETVESAVVVVMVLVVVIEPSLLVVEVLDAPCKACISASAPPPPPPPA